MHFYPRRNMEQEHEKAVEAEERWHALKPQSLSFCLICLRTIDAGMYCSGCSHDEEQTG